MVWFDGLPTACVLPLKTGFRHRPGMAAGGEITPASAVLEEAKPNRRKAKWPAMARAVCGSAGANFIVRNPAGAAEISGC